MSDTQLQIVLSLIDNASAQLQEAQSAFANLGQAGADAAAQITDALTPAEEAIVAQAQAVAAAWEDGAGEMSAAVAEAVPTIDTMLSQLAASNEEAAAQVATAWQASGRAMEDDLAAAMTEVESTMVSDATAAGEAAGTAAGQGFGGYFKKMIIGYALEQIGSFLSGGIQSAVTAAAKSGDQIATLNAQIQQQQAGIAGNEATLQKWSGTIAQVSAAHEKATANIAAEKVKIQELQQQLAPLMQTQQGLPGQMQSIETAILGWIGGNTQLEGSLQTFTTTLGPLLEWIGKAFIAITLLGVALSVLSVPMLILIGLALVIATLTAAWVTFHTQITTFFNDLNAKTGIIDLFKQAWQTISDNFTQNLLPALSQLWTALQPLAPYLQALAIVIGATLLGAIVLIVDALTIAIDLFTSLLTIATKVATFFTNVLVVALNAVESAIEAIISAVGKVGSMGGAIGSTIGGALAHIPGFAAGGIVTGPTLALVGEAGPEAIIPLSAFNGGNTLSGGGGIPGGGNIVVQVMGGYYLDQRAAQDFGNMLAKTINQNLRLRSI